MELNMPTRDELSALLRDILEEDFEIDPEDIRDDVSLYEDLDLDSIDAVDLVVKLREKTNKKIDPDAFKQVRTVEDVINALSELFEK